MAHAVPTPSSVAAVEWRDLVPMTVAEKLREIALPLPWLLLSLGLYHAGLWWWGGVASFFFFLTGLRQSHNAQNYSMGIGRAGQDVVLFLLSVLMLASMHAVQVTHLHHHRHCLADEDFEGSTARLPGWQAVLGGPVFVVRLHREAWRLAARAKRRWIAAELAAIAAALGAVCWVTDVPALRWHVTAMLFGECLTGFFAVWTVHHDCDPRRHVARTQRGRLVNRVFYNMFYHAEHHLFPAVPTCHLPELANRLDAVAPALVEKQVLPAAPWR